MILQALNEKKCHDNINNNKMHFRIFHDRYLENCRIRSKVEFLGKMLEFETYSELWHGFSGPYKYYWLGVVYVRIHTRRNHLLTSITS